jgi:hypothetical protein
MSNYKKIIADGEWKLVVWCGAVRCGQISGSHCVMHNCNDGYRTFRPLYRDFKYPCAWCGEKVPEGLQAVYVLLTDDMEDV